MPVGLASSLSETPPDLASLMASGPRNLPASVSKHNTTLNHTRFLIALYNNGTNQILVILKPNMTHNELMHELMQEVS